MIDWHIGCSGFSYKHWKENFYPKGYPQRKWFEYYCEHFRTVELNVTFYRFPDVPILSSWYQRSPDDFLFSVKAPRIITHFKKLNDCRQLLSDFYHNLSLGLKEKVGCILFQFPPTFDYTEERLEKIIESLNLSFANVVEFRHTSWWQEKVYRALGDFKITFSGMSHQKLPDEIVINAPLLYYRMHGAPQLYRSLYEPTFLKQLVENISEKQNVNDAYIFFNNDNNANAVINARQMMEMVGRHKK